MGKYIITYDADIDSTRKELRDRILSYKDSIELAETSFLLCINFEKVESIYQDLEFNKEKDNFVIIDIENCMLVKHTIECKSLLIKDKIEKLLKKSVPKSIKTFTQFIDEKD